MKRLRVITVEQQVPCPYQRKVVSASVCFIGQRSPTNQLCFGCPDGAALEEKYGTRTFVRRVVDEGTPDGPVARFRVKVSKKKRGVDYTYARLNKDSTVTLDLMETVVAGTMLTTREHHGLLSEFKLAKLRKQAARARSDARSGRSG